MSDLNRLLAKLDRADDCWPFKGARSARGYGRFAFAGKNRLAHRVAYELLCGPVPDGAVIMHSCDNPPCCNPAHLRIGTQSDNVADMRSKGREVHAPKGEYHWAAKISAAQAKAIRAALLSGQRKVALARQYGLSRRAISHIAQGRSWRGIEGAISAPSEIRKNRSLSFADATDIRRRAEGGAGIEPLAAEYGVSKRTIGRVVSGETYRDA
jgi:hypothetical protein